MEIIKPGLNIDFVGKRRLAYTLSIVLILLSVAALVVRGGPNYGVEFAGGILLQIQFQKPVAADEIRAGLAGTRLADSSIQSFGDGEGVEFLIRAQDDGGEMSELSQLVLTKLTEKFGKDQVQIRRVEAVGPKVGQDLRQKALFAIYYALLFILIYISGRFEYKWIMSIIVAGAMMAGVWAVSLLGAGVTWLIVAALAVMLLVSFVFQLKYAMGAIVALMHDVMVTIGAFALLNKEIDLTVVAALLTIIGFSLNDTIVIYDRIRENLRKGRKKGLDQLINESVNETLSRTILTTGTVLFTVIALWLLGGPVIDGFAFAMLVGCVSGTYSTVYVASPILLLWPDENGPQSAKNASGSGKKTAAAS
jgi:preprotein translocase subunit SecF